MNRYNYNFSLGNNLFKIFITFFLKFFKVFSLGIYANKQIEIKITLKRNRLVRDQTFRKTCNQVWVGRFAGFPVSQIRAE